jgi:predicted RNase H-like HicB family nuclease
MAKKYIAFIELDKEDKDSVFGVVFPDFPGCISCGDDYDEAYRNAHEALALHISGLREDGLAIPEPRTLEEIEREWEDFGDWKGSRYAVAYINALPASQTKTFTISMDVRLMADIDSRTKNRSAFLAAAARQYIEDHEEPVRKQV